MLFVNGPSKSMPNTIQISIAYITPTQQWLKTIDMSLGCTIHQALNQVGFFKAFPELTVHDIALGVFGIKNDSLL